MNKNYFQINLIFIYCCLKIDVIYFNYLNKGKIMSPNQLIAHYGSDNKAALNLGLTVQAVRIWVRKGEIPIWSQNAIAWITRGKLKPGIY